VPYRLQPRPGLYRDIAERWGLSTEALCELHMRLALLRDDPKALLVGDPTVPDGMVYPFAFDDPHVTGQTHFFRFVVRYSADEETILLLRATHLRRDAL
jgi:hypothetical protein